MLKFGGESLAIGFGFRALGLGAWESRLWC